MEDNLLLIQQINPMKEGEELKGFNDVVIQAAQQHIDSINTVFTLGVSWLKEETDFALRFIQGILFLSRFSYYVIFFLSILVWGLLPVVLKTCDQAYILPNMLLLTYLINNVEDTGCESVWKSLKWL